MSAAEIAMLAGLLRRDGEPDLDNLRSIRSSLVREGWLRRTPDGLVLVRVGGTGAIERLPRVYLYVTPDDVQKLACRTPRPWWVLLNNRCRVGDLAPFVDGRDPTVPRFWMREAWRCLAENHHVRADDPDLALQQALLWLCASPAQITGLASLGEALQRVSPPAGAPTEDVVAADRQTLAALGYLDLSELLGG